MASAASTASRPTATAAARGEWPVKATWAVARQARVSATMIHVRAAGIPETIEWRSRIGTGADHTLHIARNRGGPELSQFGKHCPDGGRWRIWPKRGERAPHRAPARNKIAPIRV
jgi:hypothetical protein